MSRPKVVQILYSGLGGHGSVATSLVDGDVYREWIHGLVFYGVEDVLPDYRAFCESRRIEYRAVKKKPGWHRGAYSAVLRALADLRPDVIILHSVSLTPVVWAYCRATGTKFIGVEHTPHVIKTRAEKIASLMLPVLAAHPVYLTDTYLEDVRRRFDGWPGVQRAVVIPNGLDTKRFSPTEPPADHDPTALAYGMMGRFSPPKDQRQLVLTFAGLLERGAIGQGCVLHLAGTGVEWQRVKDTVDATGRPGNFVLHGLLDENGVIAFLRRLDVYVHASRSETMCTSVMQAMACGLPVVGSDIDGIRELFKPHVEGILFPNADPPDALADALVRVWREPELRERLGRAARKRAEVELSNINMFRRYRDVIAGLT